MKANQKPIYAIIIKPNPTIPVITSPIKLLNHHETPITPEVAQARRERRAGCSPLRRRIVVVLMLFTSFILFLMEFMVSRRARHCFLFYQNHCQFSHLSHQMHKTIKVLNYSELSITLEQALARKERRARSWPLRAEASLFS